MAADNIFSYLDSPQKLFNLVNSVIYSPEVQQMIFPVSIIMVVIAICLLGFIVFLFIRTNWLRYIILENIFEFVTYKPYGFKKIEKPWLKIMSRLEKLNEAEYKLAIIEADVLLNDLLKKIGYGGQALGDRLKQLTSASLPNIEEVWQAHQVRNHIIHDPDYRLTLDDARKILGIYEQAFRLLEVLE